MTGCHSEMSVHEHLQPGDTQVESEVCLHLQVYGPLGIMNMWWHSPHDGSAAMGEYRLFRGTSHEGEEEEFILALSVRPGWDWMELCLSMVEETAVCGSGLVGTPTHELCTEGVSCSLLDQEL